MGLLDALIYGVRTVLANDAVQPLRSTINLIGATIADNVAEDRLDVTIAGTGNLPKLTLLDQALPPDLTLAATVLGSSAGVLSIVSPVGARRTFEAGAGVATKRQVTELIGSPVRTTNTTPTTLLTIPVPQMSIIACQVEVMGLKSDGTVGAWETFTARAARGTGSPYGPGSSVAQSIVTDDDDIGGHSVMGSFTGSALVLTITGHAATTIDWVAAARIVTFTP